MFKSLSQKEKWILIGILIISTLLIFTNLSRPDILSDDGHYALRALGYFDYLGSSEQTTPVQWFSERPLWSYLSFHDHPPLFFFLQHILFSLFGSSIFVSRILSALAGLFSIYLIFLITQKLSGNKIALITSGLLAVNSYFIWMSRLGLIESLLSFFILLSTYFFIKAKNDYKYYYYFFASLGLSILTKYTVLFLFPAFFIFLIFRHKKSLFYLKELWYGCLITLIITLPIIIYNLKMYQTRGHFDVQLADLFNQPNTDWPILSDRLHGFSLHIIPVLKTLIDGLSWPIFILFIISVLLCLYQFKQKKYASLLPLLIVISFIFFFSLVGSAPRWLGIMSPFIILIIGLSLKDHLHKFIIYPLLILGIHSFIYTLNTNILITPLFPRITADMRVENYGYNQLDIYVTNLLKNKKSDTATKNLVNRLWFSNIKPSAISNISQEKKSNDPFSGIIIYDSNTDWFKTVWLFDKWKIYHQFFIASSEEFALLVKDPASLSALESIKAKELYVIKANQDIIKSKVANHKEINELVSKFKEDKIEPEIIYNNQNQPAFYIYKTTL